MPTFWVVVSRALVLAGARHEPGHDIVAALALVTALGPALHGDAALFAAGKVLEEVFCAQRRRRASIASIVRGAEGECRGQSTGRADERQARRAAHRADGPARVCRGRGLPSLWILKWPKPTMFGKCG